MCLFRQGELLPLDRFGPLQRGGKQYALCKEAASEATSEATREAAREATREATTLAWSTWEPTTCITFGQPGRLQY